MLDKESVLVMKKKLAASLQQMRATLLQVEAKLAEVQLQVARQEGALALCDQLLVEAEAPEPVEK